MKIKLSLLTIVQLLSTAYGADPYNVLAFYDGTYDAAHINFVHEAIKWLPEHSAQNGFTFHSTNDWSKMNQDNLKKYKVVMFLDGVPYGQQQRQAFQHYIEQGGGWIGFHVCAYNDKKSDWPWFHETLLGTGTFKSNTWWPTKVTLHNDAQNHPAMKGIPQKFGSSVSEWYAWEHDLRKNPDIEILASIDGSSFPVGTDPNQSWYSGYYPIIWSNKKHKVIYANFGHNYMDYKKNVGLSSTFASADQNKFLFQALNYLAGR